jgi:transcriptional regulator with XRE-family HTH domain
MQPPVLKALAARIKELRLAKKLSQEELSFRSGLHRTALSLIERGERDPKLITLLKVAEKGLGISVAELLEGISLRGMDRRVAIKKHRRPA